MPQTRAYCLAAAKTNPTCLKTKTGTIKNEWSNPSFYSLATTKILSIIAHEFTYNSLEGSKTIGFGGRFGDCQNGAKKESRKQI